MNTAEGMRLLDREFIFYSTMWYLQSPVSGFSEAERVERLRRTAGYHKALFDAGVRIHTFDLPTGWRGDGTFDYTDTDLALEAFFSACPDALVVPRISNFNSSPEWDRAHPEDVYLFENARNASPEEIRAMVGDPRYQAVLPMGRDRNGERIGHQSFSSPVWQREALEALGKLIDHLEASKYAPGILGYHVGYGNCGETHFWGSGPDYSKANKAAFYAFGLKKYGTPAAMEAAWGTGGITPETVPLPGAAHAFPREKTLSAFLHEGDTLYLDYNEFTAELSYSLVHAFAKTIKDRTDKLVGIFHGYLTYSGVNHHGQTDFSRVLEDPCVDFMAAPKTYYRAGLGEPCGSHSVPQSVNRKMRWVEEVDDRSHLVGAEPIWGGAKTAEEFTRIMRREFARCEAVGSPFWWMDLGGGWYDDETILDEMRSLCALKQKLRGRRGKSRAQILLVLDERCANYVTQDDRYYFRATQDTIYETALTGAPYDLYRLEDLETLELARYRLVVFMNGFEMTPARFEALGFAPETRFVWNLMPGRSLADAEKICGMRLAETLCGEGFPLLEILPGEGVRPLARYADPTTDIQAEKSPFLHPTTVNGVEFDPCRLKELPAGEKIRTASRGRHCVCAAPSLTRWELRSLAEEAGCVFTQPVGTVVYGDDRFTGVFTAERAEITLN